MKKKSVTLIITQKCNLNCIYCYEKCKTPNSMPIDTAINILSRELSENSETTDVEIDFFGGEPFLEFSMMAQVTDYILSLKTTKKWTLSAITNGTLVHDEIQRWLIDHRQHFTCSLSLDGTKSMQDINRNMSFDKIDLDFFKAYFPGTYVKMTISEKTLSQLSEGTIFLHNNGFQVANNLAYGIDWHKMSYQETLIRELKRLVTYYIQNPSVSICSMLRLPYLEMYSTRGQILRNCSAGQDDLHVYDVDDQLYPCHMFTPLSLGNGHQDELKGIVFPKKYVCRKFLDEKCQNCPIVSFCQFCYGSNFIESGNIYHVDNSICKINQIIFHYKALLYAKKWELGQLDMSHGEERALLDTILRINQYLKRPDGIT